MQKLMHINSLKYVSLKRESDFLNFSMKVKNKNIALNRKTIRKCVKGKLIRKRGKKMRVLFEKSYYF